MKSHQTQFAIALCNTAGNVVTFAVLAANLLQLANTSVWAEMFVELQMLCFRKFSHERLTSTAHGIDRFDNIIKHYYAVTNPETVAAQGYYKESGPYGDNFRWIVQQAIDDIEQRNAQLDLEQLTLLRAKYGQ